MDLVEGLKPAIVAIATNDGKDVIGTGFFVTPNGYILTCYHVVGEVLGTDNTVEIKTSTNKVLDAFFDESKSQKDPDIDFAVLKVDGLDDCSYLRLGTTFDLHYRWCTLGFIYPKTFECVPDDGKIYALISRRNQKGKIIELTANNEINPGASGSPVLTEETGSVIGIIKSVAGKVQIFAVPIKDVFDRWPELEKLNADDSPTLLDIKDIVSEFLLDSSGDRPGKPHEIRDPPDDFKGRIIELQEMDSNFNRGVIISGMGGVGKTALAYRLAEVIRYRYPNGQIKVDMKGTSTEPLSPADAMSHIIHAIDPSIRLSDNEDGLQGQYNSILSEKRVLVLLDNAMDDKQVRPIVPPKSCGVIITSRRRFTIPGFFYKDLDPLQSSDALDLIIAINDQIGDQAHELAKLCGNLPLAIRASASLLVNTPGLSPAKFIEELKEERLRLERIGEEGVDMSIEACFNLSFARLTDTYARVFCAASVFPADFSAQAEEEICRDIENRSLNDLVKWNLIDFIPPMKSRMEGRYRLHDLTRIFAASRLDPSTSAISKLSHSEYYNKILFDAEEMYSSGGDNIFAGLGLFDQEWSNAQAGQAWAASVLDEKAERIEQAELNSRLYLCCYYPIACPDILNLRLHPRVVKKWLEDGLIAARKLKDRSAEAALLLNLGVACENLGDYSQAIKYFDQDLAICHEMGNRAGESKALLNLGNAHYFLSEYQQAINYYKRSLEICREVHDIKGEGDALGDLGSAYKKLCDFGKAIHCQEKSLEISREIGDRKGEGSALSNLGTLYDSVGEYSKAIQYHDQYLSISREIGDRLGEGNALGNIGLAYLSLGEYDKAIEYCSQNLAIAREMGDRLDEGNSLSNLGLGYQSLGKNNNAIECFEQHLIIARQIGDRWGEGNALGNLGLVHHSQGEYDKAIECFEQHLIIARQIGDESGQGTALGNLGMVNYSKGEFDKAIEYFEQHLTIAQNIGDMPGECTALGNLGSAHYSKGELIKTVELSLHQAIAEHLKEVTTFSNFDKVPYSTEEFDKAIEYFQQHLSICRQMGNRLAEGNALWSIALALDNTEQHERAIENAQEALKIFDFLGSPMVYGIRQIIDEWQKPRV